MRIWETKMLINIYNISEECFKAERQNMMTAFEKGCFKKKKRIQRQQK